MELRLITFSRPPALDAAEREGYLAREGISLQVSRATSSTAQLAALLVGECDLVHTAADNVLARVEAGERDLRVLLVADLGVDLRLVARGIDTLSGLAGRPLGVDSPESGHALLLYTILGRAGVRRGEPVALGSSAKRAEGLRQGVVDAALLSPPHDAAVIAEGGVVLAECAREFPAHPGLTVAARASWAATHRDAVVAYLRALLAGQRVVGTAVPQVARQRDALRGALTLRRALHDRRPVSDADLDRAFDPSYALAADPALAGAP